MKQETYIKVIEIKNTIKGAESVDEMVEGLFWLDCYIVDDGQYIQDVNAGKVYTHNKPWFASITDLMKYDSFELVEVDEDIIEELELL